MLAYSSVAQIGYMVLGVSLADPVRRPDRRDRAHVQPRADQDRACSSRSAASCCASARSNIDDLKPASGGACRSRWPPWTVGGLGLIGVPLTGGLHQRSGTSSGRRSAGRTAGESRRHRALQLVACPGLRLAHRRGRLLPRSRRRERPSVREAPLAMLVPTCGDDRRDDDRGSVSRPNWSAGVAAAGGGRPCWSARTVSPETATPRWPSPCPSSAAALVTPLFRRSPNLRETASPSSTAFAQLRASWPDAGARGVIERRPTRGRDVVRGAPGAWPSPSASSRWGCSSPSLHRGCGSSPRAYSIGYMRGHGEQDTRPATTPASPWRSSAPLGVALAHATCSTLFVFYEVLTVLDLPARRPSRAPRRRCARRPGLLRRAVQGRRSVVPPAGRDLDLVPGRDPGLPRRAGFSPARPSDTMV